GILVILTLALLILQCGDEGETKHYKYIANAEWSPISSQTLIISKDEYDETTGKTSGCGNEVYDVSLKYPSYKIFFTDTAGFTRKQITSKGFVPPFQLKWSPTGDRFLLWGNSISTLHIIDTMGNILTTDSLGYIRDADWSPDGSSIVCSAVRQTSIYARLYTVYPTTAHVTQLLADSIHTGAVAWSKQDRIAFAYSSENTSTLVTIAPDGTNLQNHDNGGYFNTIKWSPNGYLLLYSKRMSSSYDAYLLDVSSGATQQILKYSDSTQISSMRFSPDGTMISYYLYYSPDQFYLYVRDLANWITYSIAQQSTDGSWSPDSRSIAYVYYNVVYTKQVR
ncbi:MAG: hypothetical protein HY800_03370, partial [Ignavibacteriales bacterium]|nr:hypothetical protein [Ignavibacteriales bacterium]